MVSSVSRLVDVNVVERIVVVAVVVVISDVDITLVVVCATVVLAVDHFVVVVVSIVDVFIVVVWSVVDSVVDDSSNPIDDPVVSPVVDSDPYSVVVKKAVSYSVVDPGDVSVVGSDSIAFVLSIFVVIDVDSVVGPVVDSVVIDVDDCHMIIFSLRGIHHPVNGKAVLVGTDIVPSVVPPVVISSVLPLTFGVKTLVKKRFE